MERWDILNADGERTGQTIVRGDKLQEGQYHLVVHIWIMDSEGRFLIQKRSEQVEWHPGIWAATGGSALTGEDSLHAAQREVLEELGLDIELRKFKLLERRQRKDNITDIWAVKADLCLQNITILEEEVSDVRLVSKEELRGMIRNGEFYNYGADYFQTVLGKLG